MTADNNIRLQRKPVSIRRKLFFAFTSLIAVIAVFIFFYFPAEHERDFIRLNESKAESIGEMVAQIVSDGVARHDTIEVETEIKEMSKTKDIAYIVIREARGSILAAYNQEGAVDALYTEKNLGSATETGCVKAIKPIMAGGRIAGTLYIGLTLRDLPEELYKVRMTILIFSLVTIIAGSILVLSISTWVTDPLRKLVDTTKFISGGNLDKRVVIHSGDEFETLSQSFNQMLDNLNAAQKELSELNKDLERAVEERTKELEKEVHHHRETAGALRESEARFRTIFEKAGMGMIVTDLSGKIIETNEAFAEWSGYQQEELRSMTFQEITHPEDLKNELLFYSEGMLASGDYQPFTTEKRYIHKSGQHIWGRLTITFLRDRSQVPLLGFGMVEDRTQKRLSEEQMKKQTILLRGVAESTNILLTESDFAAAMSNCLRLLGEATEVDRAYLFENFNEPETGLLRTRQLFEWTNKTVSAEIDNPELQNLDFPPDLYASLTTGEVYTAGVDSVQGVMREIMIDEGILSLLVVPVYVRGSFWGFIGFDDCHKQRTWSNGEESILQTAAAGIGGAIQREWFERELRTVTDKAVESDKLKSSLLSNMSHEFRTPINGILGFSELLMEELQDTKRFTMAKRINNSSKRLMRTLVSLLTYSELESNKIKPDLRNVKLTGLTESVLYPAIGKASEKNLDFEFIHTDNSLAVKTDPQLFTIAMDNILDNAVKFTKTGKITVNLSNDTTDAYISVADTGSGIPSNKIDIVFQEFRQASEGMGRGYEGSGLGLTIARKLCRLVGGDLTINSVEGEGTTVVIKLPLPELKEQEKPDSQFLAGQSTNQKNKVNPDVSILLVEDNKTNADVTSSYLKNYASTDIAPTGAEAILLAAKKQYNLILMDINLGQNMTGIDVAREIRRMQTYDAVPIVAVTGYAMAGDREKLLSEGFDEYISKPFDKNELLKKIKRFTAKEA